MAVVLWHYLHFLKADMVTTSLKLPDALKKDIQQLAIEKKISVNAFMVSVLEEEIERRKARAAFLADGEAAIMDIEAGGPVYEASEVRRYITEKLQAHGTGVKVERPRPMKRVEPSAKTAARR